MLTLNIQTTFILQFTVPIQYYSQVQDIVRRIGLMETTEGVNENLCKFTVACNIQDAALIDTLINRIIK
jgi:hypothetical protein